MLTKTIHKILFALVIVFLLLASFFAGRMQKQPTAVQAQEIQEGENRSSFLCHLTNVAAFENRIHIRCSTPVLESVYYFAIESTSENEMLINRVMAISITSLTLDQSFYVYYDSFSSNNPPGCNTGDCRKLEGVSWVK